MSAGDSAPRAFLDGKVVLHGGDSRELVKGLAPDCLDAVVTDPPYALVSIVKRFGKEGAAPAKGNDAYRRASAGFMGKQWDTGEVAFDPEFWADVLAAMKPGAHLVAFSGTRSYHRLACAIEDAGFEIRDQLAWVYGSGFPKSHDVSKAIDKKLGTKGEFGDPKSVAHAGWIERGRMRGDEGHEGYQHPWMQDEEAVANAARQYLPGSPEAQAWQGWGTALKPAWEPIVLARKPLAGTVAETVLTHGTGALNIDGCRVEGEPWTRPGSNATGGVYGDFANDAPRQNDKGRWPANIIHDGSDEVVAQFPADAGGGSGGSRLAYGIGGNVAYGCGGKGAVVASYADSGSAARFFYTAKADGDDRLGSKHPTVKPVDLMQWLVRLICPKGGTVLDPFGGTGTTGEAAWREGCRAILFEREAEYREDIARRMELGLAPVRMRKAAARRAPAIEIDEGGLFGSALSAPDGGASQEAGL